MSIRVLVRSLFAIWVMAVAALFVISYPGSKDILMSVSFTKLHIQSAAVPGYLDLLLCEDTAIEQHGYRDKS